MHVGTGTGVLTCGSDFGCTGTSSCPDFQANELLTCNCPATRRSSSEKHCVVDRSLV